MMARRNLFPGSPLKGNMVAHPELPEGLIDLCVGVLQVMLPNERDLIRIIVEIISELRDPGAEVEESVVNRLVLLPARADLP